MKKTEPWYYKYLRREINKLWGWDPQRKRARNRALITQTPEDLFECEQCGLWPFTRKEVQIDHVIPRESTSGWDGWDQYVERTFAAAELLQVICKKCHSPKSAKENAARRAVKNG